jgi:hypothetical protein
MTAPSLRERVPDDIHPDARKALSGVPLYVAAFAVVVWLGFSVFLMARSDSADVEWTRLAWVFGSIQAVAFAAAGALFGTAVQRERAVDAESRATEAAKVADENRTAASHGRALAAAIQADAQPAAGGSGGGLSGMGTGGGGSDDETRRRHAHLARSLFGDLV